MKVEWGTVLAVVIGMLIVTIIVGLLTKKKVDANTGEVKTKFVGFEGDKKDNMDGED